MLPTALQKALTRARATLDAEGRLPLPKRRAIWDAIGPYEFDEDGYAEGLPHLRRIELVITLVEHLIPAWQAVQPEDDHPQRILATINAYLDGDAYADELLEVAQSLAELEETLTDPTALAIADATLHAVHVTFHDEAFGTADELDEHDLDDADLTDAERDATYFAATAQPDDAARRDLWAWYIDHAVPTAYTRYEAPDDEA